MDWHHSRTTDLSLRLSGAALCGLAWLAIRTLLQQRLSLGMGPAAFALAGVGFLGASIGAMLLMIGHHIFDDVETSAQWRPPVSFAQTAEQIDARWPESARTMENICEAPEMAS